MCNSGTCPHEQVGGRNWGECRKKSWQTCPDNMDEDDYQDEQDKAEERADYLYEQQRERKWEQ